MRWHTATVMPASSARIRNLRRWSGSSCRATACYFSNFDAGASPAAGTNGAGVSVHSDGNDRLFGDRGNDWIVGGTGKDHAFGGWDDDLIDMDDDQIAAGGLDDQPDTATSYEDVAYGGAGGDVLTANTGGDRPINSVGAFFLLGAILALRRSHHQSGSGTGKS